MPIVYNGTNIDPTQSIVFNNVPLSKIICNGTLVWESSTVIPTALQQSATTSSSDQ